MKILFEDQKKGELKLKAETLDDLWHLSHIIVPGDYVRKKTSRKIKIDFEGRTETDKKPMTLGIRVEKVEFHEFETALRVGGLIESGPEDVSGHHTFSIELGDIFNVIKAWTRVDIDRLKTSKETPKAVLCAADRERAVFATLHPEGFRIEFTLNAHLPRKDDGQYETALKAYYDEVARKVKNFAGKKIIGGPGFVKEHLAKRVPGALIVPSSSATKSGIREMLESDELERVMGESHMRKEATAIHELLKRIATDDACTYGFNETKDAAKLGAVDTILVSEQTILDKRKNGTYQELDALLVDVENQGGSMIVVSSESEHGRKLIALGGVAALLRYKVK